MAPNESGAEAISAQNGWIDTQNSQLTSAIQPTMMPNQRPKLSPFPTLAAASSSSAQPTGTIQPHACSENPAAPD
jgi:hypothetical protein